MTITVFEPTEGGAFEATLNDIVLEEFDADANDFVVNGEVTCLDDTALSMSTKPLPGAPVWTAPVCADGTEGFTATYNNIFFSSFGAILATATTTEAFPRDEMRLELYGDYEAGGVYQIDDLNYNTCETCLSIQTNCTEESADISGGTCDTRYNAGAGTLTITTLDETTGEFVGLIENAQFIEVDQEGLHTINVDNAAGWCVDSITISGFAPVGD
ncbi:hypothetical protein DN745_05935 [Bradymonas sediminis]|uniref:Uncharacterized protein n=2 Tax=Bradymonas sediminis TaxID=1548548 RepID=A0A2Z4FIZ0_9DELT|nr:hypothetical protein DN745_05935 [Bradymonas sediminis]